MSQCLRFAGLLLPGLVLQAFRRPRVRVCACGNQNAVACQNRKTTGWEWPHDWMVISAIDLATFCGIYSTTGPHLGPIAITVKICVNLTPSQAPTRLPWAGALVILVKKLSKMAGNLTSRPLKTMLSATPCIAIQSWRTA